MTEIERIGWELGTEANIIQVHGPARKRKGTPRKTVLQACLARLTNLRDRLMVEVKKL